MITTLLLLFGVATAGVDQPVWEASITLPAEAASAYGLAVDTLGGDDPAQEKLLSGLVGRYSVHLDRIDVIDAAGVAMPRSLNIYANGHELWFETRGTPPYHLRVGPKSARGDHDRPAPPLQAQIEQIRQQRGAMMNARGAALDTNDFPNLVLPMAQAGTLHQTGSVVETPPPDPNVELHGDNLLVLGIASAATLALVLLAALDARLRGKTQT
jgi:hypothetical protein